MARHAGSAVISKLHGAAAVRDLSKIKRARNKYSAKTNLGPLCTDQTFTVTLMSKISVSKVAR